MALFLSRKKQEEYSFSEENLDILVGDLNANKWVQKGDEVICDKYGVPINIGLKPDKPVRKRARKIFKTIYGYDPLESRRVRAGRELGYSRLRIRIHEKLRAICGL